MLNGSSVNNVGVVRGVESKQTVNYDGLGKCYVTLIYNWRRTGTIIEMRKNIEIDMEDAYNGKREADSRLAVVNDYIIS